MNARIHVLITAVAIVSSLASAAWSQQKPLDEQGVHALLDLGLDEEIVLARIKKGGVAFEATDEIIGKLKGAGASDAVIAAVQAAARSKPAAAAPGAAPITYDQVKQLLQFDLGEEATLKRIARTPPIFTLGAAQEDELVKLGATPKIIAALKGDRPAAPAARDITDLAIILDCSGSMQELTKEGESKMEAAKRIVADLVRKIPAGLNVTFVIYGHEVFAGDDPRNCQAVKVARPLGALDEPGRAALLKLIGTLRPTGATPIANAMKLAGDELARNNALCGMVVLTDGVESCKGNPAGEAADLLGRLKIAFGVNVVGFGVKAEDDAILEAIAKAGNGKYYGADSSAELAERMSALTKELVAVAKPPEVVATDRRAIKVLQPDVDLMPMKEILLAEADKSKNTLNNYVKGKSQKYGEEIRVPSGSAKYDVWWVPQEGEPIQMVKDLTFPERKIVTLKPEDYLGLVQVGGTGAVKQILVVPAGTAENTRNSYTVQEVKKYGDIMVVPAGKYDIWVDDNIIEEDVEIAPGKLRRL
jgi:hypothetical protein